MPPRSTPIEKPPLFSRPGFTAAALAFVHLLFSAVAFNPTPHTGGDGGTYMALAQSLVHGYGYVDLWDPARPPHTQFPPVFPAILALASLLGFGTWMAGKVIVLAFSCAAVAVCYRWLRRVTTPRMAVAVGAALAVAPGVLNLSHWELSDIPFWFFTAAALLAFARFDAAARRDETSLSGDAHASTAGEAGRRPSTEQHPPAPRKEARSAARGEKRKSGAKGAASPDRAADRRATAAESVDRVSDDHALRWLLIASALTAVADLTRSAGLPLVLAAGIWLLWRHGWRRAAVYAAVAGPGIFAWWLRGRAYGGGYTGYLWYLDPYQPALGYATPLNLAQRVGKNAARYATGHLPFLLVGLELGPLLSTVVGSGLVVLGAVGWARRLRRAGLAEVWLPLYAGVLLLWPITWSGERLVLPVLPLLMLYSAEVVRDQFARPLGRRAVSLALAGAFALAMLPAVAAEAHVGSTCTAEYAEGDRFPCMDPEFTDFMNLAVRLRGRLPAGTVVLSRKPTMFFALAGYPSRVYPLTADPDSFFRAAAAIRARYVVVDHIADLSPLYLQPVLLARREWFCVIPDPYTETAALARIEPGPVPRPANAPPNAFRSCPLP